MDRSIVPASLDAFDPSRRQILPATSHEVVIMSGRETFNYRHVGGALVSSTRSVAHIADPTAALELVDAAATDARALASLAAEALTTVATARPLPGSRDARTAPTLASLSPWTRAALIGAALAGASATCGALFALSRLIR
jgi:hypothetical protein